MIPRIKEKLFFDPTVVRYSATSCNILLTSKHKEVELPKYLKFKPLIQEILLLAIEKTVAKIDFPSLKAKFLVHVIG